MTGRPRFRAEVVWSAALLLLLGSLVGTGCRREETTRVASSDDASGEVVTSVERAPAPLPPEVEGSVEAPEATLPAEPEVVELPREVTYREAEQAFFDRSYEEAVTLFALYVEKRPSNPWGYYMLGLSAWKNGENLRAEDAFRTALELDPEHLKSHLNLSRVLLEDQRSSEALAIVEEALKLEPESGVAFRLRARTYNQLGRVEDAVTDYRKAILIDDDDVWSMNNLGLILIEEERFEEALRPLARAVVLKSDVPVFHNNLGVALERTGHLRAAEDAYRKVLTLSENYGKAELNLARVAELKEDPELPVDLTKLAESFVDEVEGWREAVVYREPSDPIELEPVIVSAADTSTIEPAPGDTLKGEGPDGESSDASEIGGQGGVSGDGAASAKTPDEEGRAEGGERPGRKKSDEEASKGKTGQGNQG